MRRLALFVAGAAALACGGQKPNTEPAPLDRFYYPTGIGVLGGRIVVASSNSDLAYASDTGGTVIAASYCDLTDPLHTCTADTVAGALRIQSFSGKVGVADPTHCPALDSAAVIVPIRGLDFVYRLAADPAGALTCDGCEIPVGATEHGDPFAVGVACGPGIARAYVGYLRQTYGSWLTQIDLLKEPGDPGYVMDRGKYEWGGQVRAFAYDAGRKRLYFTSTAVGSSTWVSFVDLGAGCAWNVAKVQDGGCADDTSVVADLPKGLELRGIGLSHQPPSDGRQRAYLTARIYDGVAAASTGARAGDFDGLLLVVDFWEDAYGKLRIDLVDQIPIGYGASDLVVLPKRTGKRDVVAALAIDDGYLWIYDDETGARVAIGRNTVSGAPLVGHDPGLTAEPEAPDGIARVYVGSFRESWVTPVDVPLDAPELAAPVTLSNGDLRRIGPQLDQAVTP